MVRPRLVFVDTNLGIDHALAAARDLGEKVYFYIPWHTAYPTFEQSVAGRGFTELEKITDLSEVESHVSVVVFVDVGFAPTIARLKKAGLNVYGCTPRIERLETDRVWSKRTMVSLGLSVTDYTVVKGVSGIVGYFKAHAGETSYVKLDLFRGNRETFRADSADSARVMLDGVGLGAYEEDVDFIIEPHAEGVEVGVDAWFCNGKFLKKHFATIEIRGQANVGHFVEDSPFVEHFMAPLEEFLRDERFTGNISAEGFWDGTRFKIMDVCCRMAFPCSASWAFGIRHYGQFLTDLTSNQLESFETSSPYQACLGIYTDDARQWRKIYVDRAKLNGNTRGIGFRRVVNTADGLYYVAGDGLLATALGGGATWEEAVMNAVAASEAVYAVDAAINGMVADRYRERISRCNELNYTF